MTKRLLISAIALAIPLTGCSEGNKTTNVTTGAPSDTPPVQTTHTVLPDQKMTGLSLTEAVAGAWRSTTDKARDAHRHPAETLAFFAVEPNMSVIEIWPGRGWYTEILAPYLAAGGGVLYTAGFGVKEPSAYIRNINDAFTKKFEGQGTLYGTILSTDLSADTGPLALEGSIDRVLTFRNIHNWMQGEYAGKAFADFYAALKPGGILGVVEHRAPNTSEQDPKAMSGYVRQDYVIALAEAAGFELVATSEINANPADTADHPFGVWTLPPSLRTASRGQSPAPDFDTAKYESIGESDRMTLKFQKPIAADGALYE